MWSRILISLQLFLKLGFQLDNIMNHHGNTFLYLFMRVLLKCRWHHPMAWRHVLKKKEKAAWASTVTFLWFLPEDLMWAATSVPVAVILFPAMMGCVLLVLWAKIKISSLKLWSVLLSGIWWQQLEQYLLHHGQQNSSPFGGGEHKTSLWACIILSFFPSICW